MKKIITISLCLLVFISSFYFDTSAACENETLPMVTSFSLTSYVYTSEDTSNNNNRATGLIMAYGLSLEKTGTTLKIYGQTHATQDVVKCGFKDLTIQRRKTSDDSWEDYYEYGNVYADTCGANLSTTLSVASGYQYRISCKHYAKKNILSVQTIANTSNIVTVS